jgi:hypothetical protein
VKKCAKHILKLYYNCPQVAKLAGQFKTQLSLALNFA